MDLEVSPAVAAMAILVSALGTLLLSFVGFYIFQRRRKAKQREQDDEKEAGAALDRAVVNYLVSELPVPQSSSAPGPRQQLGYGVTNALRTNMESVALYGPPCFPQSLYGPCPPFCPSSPHLTTSPPPPEAPPQPPTQAILARNSSPSPEISRTELLRTFHRRTASSPPLTDTEERVYGDILARPIKRHSVTPSPKTPGSQPPIRGDGVGWPLTNEYWL
ncbi:hypothetical protein N656DRAFT_332898 [Canariomyces notabilis]|uniref:Uncharacterized protein n=1 Tax=Canariomyces notabilis TaxID=2074819 RepID=A0AAN6QG81_9PEZI|nr:hypothetical protein N656DRAFT_332898 [Canariomyces arenarius]